MFCLGNNKRRHWWLPAVAFSFFYAAAGAQPFVSGQTYFGRSNYIEYAAGDLPFILSAPHGGGLTPAEIPNRTNCTTCGWDFATATDSNTDDVADKVRTELGNLTGHLPHIVICHLDRDKIDCNREVGEGAQGKAAAVTAWNEFNGFINSASNNVITNFGKGFYIDQHGQSHPEGRLELGYLLDKYDLTNSDAALDASSSFKNSSSIRTLANSVTPGTSFSKLLRGTNSFGEFMVAEGYPATPSYTTPAPFSNPSSSTSFFNGGYNTAIHGSDNSGPLSALQIEANYGGVRDTSANRTAYAQAMARTLEKYFSKFYGLNLRTCAPSVWDSASGNWSTAANWALGITPVSSNLLVFAGAGGAVTHNLSVLATGTGVVGSIGFSNAATGGYTISGNAFSLLGGITNSSAFDCTINNNVTLIGSQTVSAVSAWLTFGGGLTNGSLLRCIGNITASGVISGAGGLTKLGAGSLDLNAINTYTGPTTNQSGTISLNATSTFGNGSGLLVLAGGDILAQNTRSAAPITNSILMTASTTISGNGTLTNSTRILPFSTSNLTTSGGTLTIRNAGTNAFASNNVFRVRFTGGGFNFTQPIVIGSGGDLPGLMSQLESYNCIASGDQTFSGVISGPGQFIRDAVCPGASGQTIFTAGNTFSGGTTVAGGTLLLNNSSGSGTGSGAVTVTGFATLGGTGAISGPVSGNGNLSPGQSAGALTLGGGLDLSTGGTYIWELAALTTSGAGTNCDQILLTGGNLALAGSSKLQLNFIGSATTPNAGDPFWLTSHTWKIISLSGAATNSGGTRLNTMLNGNYATGSFTNYADPAGNILLSYIAVPASAPTIQSAAANGAGQFTLSVSTATNRTYVLQFTTNLSAPNWTDVTTNIAPGNLLTLTNATGGDPLRFYRVRVMP